MLNEKTPKFSSLAALMACAGLLGVACAADGNGKAPGTTGPDGNPAATGGSTGTATGGSGSLTDPNLPPDGPVAPVVESAGPLPLLRLTHREYTNTMAELLGDTSKPGSTFEPDMPGASGYQAPGTV